MSIGLNRFSLLRTPELGGQSGRPRSLFARIFTLQRLALWALIPLAMFALGCMVSPDRLILFPSTDDVGSIGATRRTLPFEDGVLEVWTGRTNGQKLGRNQAAREFQRPELYVLRFYGNADRADSNVGEEVFDWRPGPAEFWGVNYPGYGGSTGPAKLAKIGPAALAAFDALQQEAQGRPILVYGTSLGTTAALYVAARRPVAGVILQNPPPIQQIIRRQFGWWNLWLIAGPLSLRIPAALDSLANARATHVPAIFLLAENDDMVAPKYQRLVVDAYAGPKQVVTQRGARHNESLDRATTAEFHAAVASLLAQEARR